jgi:hypothetical protein
MHRMIQSAATRFISAAVAAALSCAPAAAGVYRCSVNGVLQFSDRPCKVGDVPIDLPAANVIEPTRESPSAAAREARSQTYQRARAEEDADWRRQHEADAARELRIREARVHGEAAVGMSAANVRAALGEPGKKTRSQRSGKGEHETWTYADADGGRTTVVLDNGIVSRVSSSSGRNSRSRP